MKSSETKSADANKIFQISIQPGYKMTLNISITENQQQNSGTQKYVFMNVYMLGIHHAADVMRIDSEIEGQIAQLKQIQLMKTQAESMSEQKADD